MSRRRTRKNRRTHAIEFLETRLLLNAGGGYTGSGILGSYYNNTTLSGSPSFTRSDDRIDFNFGTTSTPGGSNSPGFNAIGTTNWSAQWMGQVIPKYSETYTFTTTIDSGDGAQLYIRPPGAANYTEITNDWTNPTTSVETATYTMTSGDTYGIELQYYHTTGSAEVKLHWSSPSTPDEPIEPATPIGVNGGTAVDWDPSVIFADAVKESRINQAYQPNNGNIPSPLDTNGWPTTDFEFYVMAGLDADTSGLYTMTFTGSATSIKVDDESISVVSNSYNATTNVTTYTYKDISTYPTGTFGNQRVTLTGTKRTPTSATNTGVTNIAIMRPLTPGNMTASYPAGTLYTSAYESLINQFSAVRFMDYLATNSGTSPDVGGNATVNWTDRLIPADSSQQGIANSADINYQGQGGAIEYAVELCNETGKDMWINIPSQANDTYVTDLADGLLYGFNSTGGVYTQPTADPAFAPLNSNLKVYVEYSNEVWNAGFPQNGIVQSLAVAAVNANNSTGQILNYDGIGTGQAATLGQRYWALRTVQISKDFRAVWGNAAMISTVRPVFEFQYNDINNTAGDALAFISDYFDNADGITHVANLEPVSYYLYSAGGGWYNSVNTDTGLGAVTIPNNDFETPALATASSQANPTGGSWTFNGSAGLASNNLNFANASTGTTIAGSTITPTSNGDSAVGEGYSFTVGSSDVYVDQLGRWIISGNKEEHTLFLTNSSGGVLAQGDLTTVGRTAGQYAYVSIGTVHLLANQTYYVFSTEPSYDWQGFDAYYGPTCTETTFSGITIKNALSVTMPQGEWYTNLWTFTQGAAGYVAGPVDFRYITTPGTGPVTYAPATTNGSQGAYVQGTGSVYQTLTFPAGACDITYFAAEGAVSGSETISVYIDGTLLYSKTPSTTYYSFYRTNGNVDLTAGTHTLEFLGSGNGTAFIDYVQVETVAAMINSGDMSIAAQTQSEVDWAAAYGLKTTGYEGGFEIGGDGTTGSSVAAYSANVDPSVEQSTITTVDEYLSAGGNLPMVFTAVGEWWSLAMTTPYGSPNIYYQSTPKLEGYDSLANALPVPDSNATVVPGVLNPANVTLKYSNYTGATYEDNAGDIEKNTGWLSWNAAMPSSGSYTVTATTTGTGTANLIVDGNVIGTITGAGTFAASVSLAAGPHTIMVQSTGSAVITVSQIVVTEVGAPASPTITSSSFSGTTATLAWQAVANASGYVIGYGAISGQYVNFFDVGNVTTANVTGLSPTGVSYMVVYAYNSAEARSLPSAQVRVAPRSTNATVLITFNDQTDTTSSPGYATEPLVESGIAFTSYGNSGGEALQVQDGTSSSRSPGNWPFKVLEAADWGTDIIVTGSTGQAFDLYSLDVGQGSSSLSAVLTETDSSGGTQTAYVNFPTATGGANAPLIQTEHVVLDWVDIVKVEVNWWTAANGGGTQHSGAISNLLIDDAPPTVANSPAASSGTVTGTSTNLSVLGADQAGASALTYTWTATTLPNGVAAPIFSINGTNAAKNTTAYFSGAGNYVFTVTMADSYGATTTATVPVTVSQTLTGLTITPASTNVTDGTTQALTAAITDQFGVSMGTQPGSFNWSILNSSAGSVNISTGIYTAPGTGTGWATVVASGGGYSGTTALYYTPSASTVPNYYSGFSSSTGLNLEGSSSNSTGVANISGNMLQLTDTAAAAEIHSAFYSNKLSDTNFVTDFGYQAPNPFEDGFTFIIQNQSATAVSSGGGGQLGYQNITPSVGIRFDLDNTNNGNTISIWSGGSTSLATYPLATTGLNLVSGDVFHIHLAYNGSNLAITLTDTTRPNEPTVTETYAINMQTTIGSSTAWFGFGATSGGITSGVAETQDILWWTYGQPVVSVTPVNPNLVSSSLNSVTVNSIRPLTGLNLSSFSLVQNGQSVSLGGVPVIGTGDGGMAYTISNLASLTGNLGNYTFTLNAGGVADADGNAATASASASWVSNTLTAPANAAINIAGEAGSTATVTVNGGTPYNVSLSALSPMYVNGTAGNDTLTLDFTNASPVPTGGLTFTGGTGDALVVTGTAGNDTASVGGSQLIFNSSIINLPNVPTVTVNTGAGNDSLTQTSQPTATSVTFNGGSGNDQLNVSAGTYTFTADPQPLTSSLTVAASGAGTQLLLNPLTSNQIHLAGLTLTGGAIATVVSLGNLRTATNHRSLVIGAAGATSAPSFSIDPSSVLDLKDNDLIIHGGSLLTNTDNLLRTGYANGYWNGKGIDSSTAAGQILTTLGAIQPTAATTFDGESVGISDVIVKYTYYGDATLDGKVDGSDYSRIDNAVLNNLTGWYNGDFNNDGVINGSDYTLLDNAYNTQAGPLSEIAFPASVVTANTRSTAITPTAPASVSTIAQPASLIAGLDAVVAAGRKSQVAKKAPPAVASQPSSLPIAPRQQLQPAKSAAVKANLLAFSQQPISF